MEKKPFCFVLMPFGRKPSESGAEIDFDEVYESIIKPAVLAAELEPVRADEEFAGGILHKTMFERLILCEYAIADLTTANANVFYELGIRHAAKPYSTVLLFASDCGRLPIDVAQLRAIPYQVGAEQFQIRAQECAEKIRSQLEHAKRTKSHDSPLFQLLEGYPDVDPAKAEAFRQQVEYENRVKSRLQRASSNRNRDEILAIERSLGNLEDVSASLTVEVFLSYRAISAWEDMIRLVENMDNVLASTPLVQQQFALALNRIGRSEEAEGVIENIIAKYGADGESNGILGRIYKDRWINARSAGQLAAASGFLQKAISAYRAGFEADIRNFYPGLNTLTLLRISDQPNHYFEELRPVVRYALQQKIRAGEADYWIHASLLELAVLDEDQSGAEEHLAATVASKRVPWQRESTANNLRLIADHAARKSQSEWISSIIDRLLLEH